MSVTAERIKALRKQKGMTQNEFAKLIKSSRGSVAKIETDVFAPSYAMLALIADVLDTTVEYLLGKTQNAFEIPENKPDFIELTDDDVVMLYAGKKVSEANKKAILTFARMLHEEDTEM